MLDQVCHFVQRGQKFIDYEKIYGLKRFVDKKKIDKSIDFLRGWEKKIASIFCLRRCKLG